MGRDLWPLLLYCSPRPFLYGSGEHLAHCFPWEAFSHMHHSVFMHSDTNNVSMLPIPTELLFSSLWRCCLEPSAPAQLPLLLSTEHGAAASRAGFHPGTKPEARRQNVTQGWHPDRTLGSHCPLPDTHFPAPHSPAGMNCFCPETLLTKACKGNCLLLDLPLWQLLSETNGHGYKPYISTFILLLCLVTSALKWFLLHTSNFFFAMCTSCLFGSSGKSTKIELTRSW